MKVQDRRQQILDILTKSDYVTVEDFSKKLGVTTVTIRADLSALEKEGLIFRTHGGAMYPVKKSSPRFISKTISEYENEKHGIAEIAASLITDGSTIVIDSGSTTYHIAKFLRNKKLTVITNNALVSDILKDYEKVNLILLGGTLNRSTMGTIGPVANAAMNSINVDICFLGAAAYDNLTISSSNMVEAELKKTMIRSADKVVFLADSSKNGKRALSSVCTWNEVDTFITDEISEDFRAQLEEKGIEVLTP